MSCPTRLATHGRGPGAAAGAGADQDQFARALRRAVLAADPAGAADRHRAAVANRTIERLPQPEVMGSLWATMPATVADDVWNELTRRAKNTRRELKRGGGAHPGLNALRVDALVHAVLGNGGADPAAPTMTTHDHGGDHDDGGRRPAAPERSTVAPRGCRAAAAAGRRPRRSCSTCPPPSGWPTTPVSCPATARSPARWPAAWPPTGTGSPGPSIPTAGRLLGRGAGCYRPSAPLRAFIAARDRTCGFPGCPRTATDCDCDHIENFDSRPGRGGKTVPANLGPLCRQHHNAKTHGHWQLHYDPDTAIKTWTSPLGKTYTEGTDPPLL